GDAPSTERARRRRASSRDLLLRATGLWTLRLAIQPAEGREDEHAEQGRDEQDRRGGPPIERREPEGREGLAQELGAAKDRGDGASILGREPDREGVQRRPAYDPGEAQQEVPHPEDEWARGETH